MFVNITSDIKIQPKQMNLIKKNSSPQTSSKQQDISKKQQNSVYLCEIVKVITDLYIGDMHASNHKTLLNGLSIKNIIVAGAQLKCYFPKDFNYLHLQVRDSVKQPISDHFDKTNNFIQKALQRKQAILVHCAFGKSRSAAIIIAYLMYKFKMESHEALNFLRRKRREVSPNQGFLNQLKLYEKTLKSVKVEQNK